MPPAATSGRRWPCTAPPLGRGSTPAWPAPSSTSPSSPSAPGPPPVQVSSPFLLVDHSPPQSVPHRSLKPLYRDFIPNDVRHCPELAARTPPGRSSSRAFRCSSGATGPQTSSPSPPAPTSVPFRSPRRRPNPGPTVNHHGLPLFCFEPFEICWWFIIVLSVMATTCFGRDGDICPPLIELNHQRRIEEICRCPPKKTHRRALSM